jgi:hypothetical protein
MSRLGHQEPPPLPRFFRPEDDNCKDGRILKAGHILWNTNRENSNVRLFDTE